MFNRLSEFFMRKYLYLLLLPIIVYTSVQARPQYTQFTGNKCMNCHVNPNGGGLRSELGWYSNHEVGLIPFKDTPLNELYKLTESNQLADGLFTVGADVRIQSIERPNSNNEMERETFLMQASPYISVSPFQWMAINAHYNFSDEKYPSQSDYTAEILLTPGNYLYPYVRAGMIKPSIGLLYDDHTILSRSNTILVPDYAEPGVEVGYEGFKYMSLTAGAYKTQNLGDGTGGRIAGEDDIAGLLRVAFVPQFFEYTLTTNIGSSVFMLEDYYLVNSFIGLGWKDKLSFIAEYSFSEKSDFQKTNNITAEAVYQILSSLHFTARYEKGTSEQIRSNFEFEMERLLAGLHIYLLPGIEIRPEYRLLRTGQPGDLGDFEDQFAFQLHLYY